MFDERYVGTKTQLRYHDVEEEQFLIGKDLTVVEIVTKEDPNWILVEYEGQKYSVRGRDCKWIKK